MINSPLQLVLMLFTIYGFCRCLNRSSHQMCSVKKVFLKVSQISQENTCARVSFLISLQADACNFIKKETLAQVFSCEFCEISKNTFLTEHLRCGCFCFLALVEIYAIFHSVYMSHMSNIRRSLGEVLLVE